MPTATAPAPAPFQVRRRLRIPAVKEQELTPVPERPQINSEVKKLLDQLEPGHRRILDRKELGILIEAGKTGAKSHPEHVIFTQNSNHQGQNYLLLNNSNGIITPVQELVRQGFRPLMEVSHSEYRRTPSARDMPFDEFVRCARGAGVDCLGVISIGVNTAHWLLYTRIGTPP